VPLIGFCRNIYFDWLEETASLVCLGEEAGAIRARVDGRVAEQIASDVNRRQAVDILVNVWVKSAEVYPALHAAARRLFQATTGHDDHAALHYGLTLLTYPFFRQAAQVIGQTLRFGGAVRTSTLQEKMPAVLGDLGALQAACRRMTFSLRNWGLLVDGRQRYAYVAREPRPRLSSLEMECWLLAAALRAHPADTLPFEDLVRLPELFPFELTLSARDARHCALLEVQRSGGGWDMVALAVAMIGSS